MCIIYANRLSMECHCPRLLRHGALCAVYGNYYAPNLKVFGSSLGFPVGISIHVCIQSSIIKALQVK